MALGYYNFAPIMAGNQTTANSLASLGQQIGQSIENHAQTQAAQAMLPALQSQVQQGMGKIAQGDSSGLSDVYGAATSASQLPILAPMATHAVNMANQANIQAQHVKRSEAVQDALNKRYSLAHPVDAQGNPIQKQPTIFQQSEMAKVDTKAKTDQLGAYSSLYNGVPASSSNPQGISGIADYAKKIQDSVDKDAPADPNDIRKFADLYSQYKQTQSAFGNRAISHPEIDKAYSDITDHLLKAQNHINDQIANLPQGTNPKSVPNPNQKWYNSLWTGPTDLASQKANIDTAVQNLSKLQNIGQQQSQTASSALPSVGSAGNGPVIPPEAIKHLQANPTEKNKSYFDKTFGQGAAQQLLKPQASSGVNVGSQPPAASSQQETQEEPVEEEDQSES